MESHEKSLSPPVFRFKIIDKFSDALSRQLSEALWIIEEGGLNKRHEFKINELCRLDSRRSHKETDRMVRMQKEENRMVEENLSAFINVIKNAREKNKTTAVPNLVTNYRKRQVLKSSESDLVCARKRKKMEFSTPRAPKTGDPVLDEIEISPINGQDTKESINSTNEDESGATDIGEGRRNRRLKSNVSDGVDCMAIKPAVKLTDSTEGRSLYKMSARVENILRNHGVLKRSNSDPEIAMSVDENIFMVKWRRDLIHCQK